MASGPDDDVNEDRGTSAFEYGLIAALLAVIAITALGATGESLGSLFGRIHSDLVATSVR